MLDLFWVAFVLADIALILFAFWLIARDDRLKQEFELMADEDRVIGQAVFLDCLLYGTAVWRRRADGEVERVDPTSFLIIVDPVPTPKHEDS